MVSGPLHRPPFSFFSGENLLPLHGVENTYDLVETLGGTQSSRASANDENVNGTREIESALRLDEQRGGVPYMSGWVILP